MAWVLVRVLVAGNLGPAAHGSQPSLALVLGTVAPPTHPGHVVAPLLELVQEKESMTSLRSVRRGLELALAVAKKPQATIANLLPLMEVVR